MTQIRSQRPIRRQSSDGAVWWTHGAQGGVGQPPYAVRWRGRWYRTLPLKAFALEGPVPPSMSDEMRAWVESLPPIPFGVRRVLDYLDRANKHFRDLPLLVEPVGVAVRAAITRARGEVR